MSAVNDAAHEPDGFDFAIRPLIPAVKSMWLFYRSNCEWRGDSGAVLSGFLQKLRVCVGKMSPLRYDKTSLNEGDDNSNHHGSIFNNILIAGC